MNKVEVQTDFPEKPLKRAIFIDGRNFKYATYDALGLRVDFEKLLDVLSEGRYLIRAYYYSGVWTEDAIRAYARLKKSSDPDKVYHEYMERREKDLSFLRFLNRSGYRVVTKPIKVYKDYFTGEVQFKADLDIEIVLDMLKLSPHCDEVVLVSGDGDFVPVLEDLSDKGIRTIVVTTVSERAVEAGYKASEELIDAADRFIEIEDIRDLIERETSNGGQSAQAKGRER